ncbi:MAG TPA: VirB4 family type IV secretion/conjugal transfer ATPase [Luteibacter sp.]|jgi:type IV secretion system protein VirB4|nr:VirB4 family type IV secretion/conjugal transfer ATPase [Luteibacter sp.]
MLSPKQSLMNNARPLTDYVPYSTHVSPHNLSTRSGDMLTVIKIDGVAHEAADDLDIQGWHDALTGLVRNIAAEDIALWIHTVREPRTDYPQGGFSDDFAGRLNARYRESLSGLRMMVNTHYLTVVIKGKKAGPSLPGFGDKKTIASIQEHIRDTSDRLDELSDTVLSGLTRYGARRLELYQHNGVVFSEVLEFLALLVNGERQRIAVPKGPASYGMVNTRISFGVDQFELRSPTATRVGAMLGAAAYQVERTEPGHLNILLTLPFPIVMTQSFAMFGRNKAMGALQRQRRLLVNAEDAGASQIDDISQALDDLASSRSIFGEHHLSIMLLADNAKDLAERIAATRSLLSESGFLVAREDECIEAAFFAQLPANFRMRPRPAPISSSNIIGYTGFHNYPHGRLNGNQWGPAMSLLKTTSGTPFYFNFHVPPSSRRGVDEADADDRVPGHTLLLGPTGAGKTVIQTFMLAQAEKYKPTVFTFDKDQGQANFVRAMGGYYSTLRNGVPTGFNPCALEDTPGNRTMIQQLVKRCIKGDDETFRFSPNREREVQDAVNGVYAMPFDMRRFSAILEFFDPTDPDGNAARFRKWCAGGSLGWLMDNPRDLIHLSTGRHFGFDVTDFLENDKTRTVTVMYLFHRMEQLIDGRRFILNMDEFWKMLQDDYFEGKALDAVKTYRKRNALALFGTQSPADVLRSRISRQLIEQCVSQLYLPNPKAAREDYIDGFKLSEREYEIVRKDMVEANLRGFLFKQGANSTVCELNLRGFDDELAVLSGTSVTVELAERAISQAGPLPDDWLPVFHDMRKARG